MFFAEVIRILVFVISVVLVVFLIPIGVSFGFTSCANAQNMSINYSSPTTLAANYNISGSMKISASLVLNGHVICAEQEIDINNGSSISGAGSVYTNILNLSDGSLSSANVYANNVYVGPSSTLNAKLLSPSNSINSYGTITLNQDYLNSSAINLYIGSYLKHNLFTEGGIASFTGSSTDGQSFPYSFGGSGAGGGSANTGGSNGGSTYCPGGSLGAPAMPEYFGGPSGPDQNGVGPCGNLTKYTLNISDLDGAGGGAGGTSTQYGAGANGGGGSQGLVFIGQTINLNGTVDNSGQAGFSVEGAGGGGGGGGGAGVVELLYTKSENYISNDIEVAGGAGGDGYSGASGGIGGNGEIVAFQVPQSILSESGVPLAGSQLNSTGSSSNVTGINQTSSSNNLNNTTNSTTLDSIYNSLSRILGELNNINSTLSASISDNSTEASLLESVESSVEDVYNTTLALESKETGYTSYVNSSLQKLGDTISEMGSKLDLENKTIYSILNLSLSNSDVKSLIGKLSSKLSLENESISKLLNSSFSVNASTSRLSSSIFNLSSDVFSASNLLRDLEAKVNSVNNTILSLKYEASNYTLPINYSLLNLRSAVDNMSRRLSIENKTLYGLTNISALRERAPAPVYNDYYYSICNYTLAQNIEEAVNSNLTSFLHSINKTYLLLASRSGPAINRTVNQDSASSLSISNISMLSNISQQGKATVYQFFARSGQSEALTVNCGGESDIFRFSTMKTNSSSNSSLLSSVMSPLNSIYSSIVAFVTFIRGYIYGV